MKKILIIWFVLLRISISHQSSVESDNESTTQPPKAPLIVKSIDKANGLPKETQMAQCTVTSGDIKASAQATFSKKLEGFCSTKDMNDLNELLGSIENRLLDEIYRLRQMIQTLMPNQRQNYQRYDDNYNNYIPRHSSYDRDDQNYYRSPPKYDRDYRDYDRDRNYQQQNYRNVENSTTEKFFATPTKAPEVVVMRNMFKSLEKPRESVVTPPTTPTTATTEASTEQNDQVPLKTEYIYYWKLENFPHVFKIDKKNEVFSHVFNVKGLFLRIRAVLNHLEDENLVLDIEHLANIDSDVDKFEVEISDGFVFKEIVEEKLFQFSFALMDQTRPNHDLISPVYWNTDSDSFVIPNSRLLLANYVKMTHF